MGANPGKRDAWPPQKRTRHVWVRASGKQLPRQGVIVAWRQERGRWEAWVAYVDDSKLEPALIQAWVDERNLYAVRSDPNETGW